MLKQLLLEQKQNLDYFFEQSDVVAMEKMMAALLACKGTIFFSGVGKSGHIAEKLAATFSSTGSRAFFLSPSNALHGDIGIVAKGDVVILLSKSGETRELIELAQHLKQRQAVTIAVVSHASTLSRLCDLPVFLPVKQELCPYDLAPTTSTAVQLIFGDVLAIALMRQKKFSLSEFALNHPAGSLGRKITLKVSDVMLKGDALPICKPTDLLFSVLHELSQKRCGCLLVIEEGLSGIFTDGDLRRAIELKGAEALQMPVSQFTTKNPRSIASNALCVEAMRLMEMPTPVTVLPVVEKENVVGLIRMHDILQGESNALHLFHRVSSHCL